MTFRKIIGLAIGAIVPALTFAQVASAHVVVRPAEVKTAARETFLVSVPNEHDTSVVGVRLVIPEGLESVRPFAKAGWSVSLTKSGEGEAAKVTEIVWTGGAIPVDLKDDFYFGAKAPAGEAELQWKAYETYADGTIVSWDQATESETEGGTSGPYSKTKVVSKSANESAIEAASDKARAAESRAKVAYILGAAGLVLGGLAFLSVARPKK